MDITSPDAVRTSLENLLPDTLDFLRRMVEANSFTENPAGVRQNARIIAGQFAPLGFSSAMVPSDNPAFGDHLVLHRPGVPGGPRIGLVTHLDTVFTPEEEEANNFRWSVEGDWIHGPGTNDIKGGTAMIWLVLQGLRANFPTLYDGVDWTILADASEEQMSDDFGKLLHAHLGSRPGGGATARGCLVFEAGRYEHGDTFPLVVARKGRAEFRVTAAGRAAHAGGGHAEGSNAIVQIAHFIPRIAALTDYRRDLTFTVGVIRGGTVCNRVPHHAEVIVEMRAFDPAAYADGRAAFLALFGPDSGVPVVTSADGKSHPCEMRVEILCETPSWPVNPGTDSLHTLWQETADTLGWRVPREHRSGLSDGNQIVGAVPTIDGLGPNGDFCHCSERTADGSKTSEYVQVSSFVPKALLNVLAIVRLAE